MSCSTYYELASHQGHEIVVVTYAGISACVECETCHVVLFEIEKGTPGGTRIPDKLV